MFVLAHNLTDSQIVIDADGRVLGGGEWGAVDRHDPVAQAAIGVSKIAIYPELDDSAPDLNPAARDALEQVATLEARRVELANLTSDRLERLADVAGIPVEAPGLLPDQMEPMRRLLARRTDVSLTAEPLAEPALAGDTEPSPVDDGDEAHGTGDTPTVPAGDKSAGRRSTARPRGDAR